MALKNTSGEPPTWAVAIVVASIAVVSLLFTIGEWFGTSAIPFADSSFFWVGLIALPMVTLIAVAIAAKLIETRGAVPADIKKGCAVLFAIGAGLAVAIYFLATRGPALVATWFPQSQPELAIFAACFGFLTLLMFIAAHRRSKLAQSWPSVRGTVVASAVESYISNTDNRRTRLSVVEFSYVVGGAAYRSKQIKVGMTMDGAQSYAEAVVAKYPAGREIEVHYDPANPSDAALENPTGATWIIAAAALFAFGVAAYALGIFS
ncbi:MAG: DUF3592 domain-containing protein [Pseudolabrys sp.]|nr:DUF3592 domain-containing protein [Pseudolabrys sp.]